MNISIPSDPSLSIGQCATLACILESTAPKPGNVHRSADFADTTYPDFLASAVAIGPSIQAAYDGKSLGPCVLDSVLATRQLVQTNTNLGIILLLVPLAKAAAEEDWTTGMEKVLGELSKEDSWAVYQAIRFAQPGGIMRVEEADVADTPPDDLLYAMQLASERDTIAREYISNFGFTLGSVVPELVDNYNERGSLQDAIILTFMQIIAGERDSLIMRKCGGPTAEEASERATKVLEAGEPDSVEYLHALGEFDFWLRTDGNRRNPGTSADIIAAALFVGLVSGQIPAGYDWIKTEHL